GVPVVLAGANEQQTVAVLYVLASLVQFAAFVVLLRTLFPGRMQEQTLGLLVFLLVPFNHSIHHYRDLPVVLASAAIFLLGAEFVRRFQAAPVPRWSPAAVAYVTALMLLGIWSRIEVLAFVGVLALVALLVYRRRAIPTVAIYLATATLVTATLLVMYR